MTQEISKIVKSQSISHFLIFALKWHMSFHDLAILRRCKPYDLWHCMADDQMARLQNDQILFKSSHLQTICIWVLNYILNLCPCVWKFASIQCSVLKVNSLQRILTNRFLGIYIGHIYIIVIYPYISIYIHIYPITVQWTLVLSKVCNSANQTHIFEQINLYFI